MGVGLIVAVRKQLSDWLHAQGSKGWWRWRKQLLAWGAVLFVLLFWPRLLAEYYYARILFSESDVEWIGRLEYMNRQGATPVLLRLLHSRDPWTREMAARSLDKYRGNRVVEGLTRLVREDPEEPVRLGAIDSLRKIADPEAVPVLQQAGWDDPVAADALAAMGPGGKKALLQYLNEHPDPGRRVRALRSLCGSTLAGPSPFATDPDVRGEVNSALRAPAWQMRVAAAGCVPKTYAASEAVGPLKPLLDDESYEVRIAAGRELGRLKDQAGIEAIRSIVLDRSLPIEVRRGATTAMGDIGYEGFFEILRDALHDEPSLKECAHSSLQRIFRDGDPRQHGRPLPQPKKKGAKP